MKSFILFNAILELVVGLVLFIAPGAVPELQGESAMSFTAIRMYGGAAMSLGLYALMVWKNFGPGPAQGFLKTFLLFHAAVAIAAFYGYSEGINSFIAVSALHAVLALITGYFMLKK